MSTVESYSEKSFIVNKKALIGLMRESSVIRRIMPVETSLQPEDAIYEWYKKVEKKMSQYNFELVSPRFSQFGTQRERDPIPILQNDLTYNRHEVKRLARGLLKLDARQGLCVEQIADDENQIGVAGNAATGIVSFDDTAGGTTTNMTISFDTTSFSTAVNTFETAITEAKADLKAVEYAKSEKHLLVTSDVEARMRAIFSTVDDTRNIFDQVAKILARENKVANGEPFMHYSDYLGSEAGTGTISAALICKNIDNMALITSPMEVLLKVDEVNGIHIQFAMRSAPLFYRPEAVHFDSAVDVSS